MHFLREQVLEIVKDPDVFLEVKTVLTMLKEECYTNAKPVKTPRISGITGFYDAKVNEIQGKKVELRPT